MDGNCNAVKHSPTDPSDNPAAGWLYRTRHTEILTRSASEGRKLLILTRSASEGRKSLMLTQSASEGCKSLGSRTGFEQEEGWFQAPNTESTACLPLYAAPPAAS